MVPKTKTGVCLLILQIFMFCLFTGFVHAQVVYENTGHNWTYTYSEDGPSGVQVKEVRASLWDYNIYVAGRIPRTGSYNDFAVISLTWDIGDTNWIYKYNGPANKDNNANALVIDDDYYPGYIYAAGFSDNSSSFNARDLMVIKLNPATGDTMWTYRYNGAAGYGDEALAIDIGGDRHIYVSGYTEISGVKKDFLVLKLDTLGNKTREYQLNGPAHEHDQANAIKAPKSGGTLEVFAAGYVTETLDNGRDFAVVKLDTSLSEQWHIYTDDDAHEDDECLAFNKDGSTDVIAVGYSTGIGTGKDFTVRKYTSTGLAWTYTKDGNAHVDDEAKAVCLGPYGSFFAAAGYLTDTLANGKDYAVIGLENDGDEEFVYTYNGPGNGSDEALAIGFAHNGDFDDGYFSAGYCVPISGSGRRLVVMKHRAGFSDMGFPYWVYMSYIGGGYAQANSIHVPWDGDVYIGGGGAWGKFTAIGLPEDFPPTIPELISPVDSAFLNDTTDVTLTWSQSENPDNLPGIFRYIIEIDTDPGFSSPDTVNRTGISNTTYTDTFADTLHYWRVKAKIGTQYSSDWSDVWSFAFDLTPPNIPMLISPIADAFVLDTSVTFDWGDVAFRDFPTLVHYVIQVDTDDSFPAPIVDDTMTQSTASYILTSDDRYYWRVKAYDLAWNESDYATAESFRLDILPPMIDSTTDWNDTLIMGPFSVYTKVTDLFGIDSVLLNFKRMEDPVWSPVEMIEGSGNIYFEEIPTVGMANDTVKYYIYAKDNAGRTSFDPPGAPTDYYWFIAGYDPGVMDFDTPLRFSFGLRSNPVKGKALFNLALPEAADVTLRIYDATGRLIDKVISGRQAAGYYEIPWTSNVTAGVYFYSFESTYHSEVGKLVLVQ
jgi:hypothetical protein